MNKWLKILLWVVLFSGVVAILIWEQSEESSADIKMPLIQITVTGQDTFLTQDEVINRLQTQQIFDPQGSVADLDIALAMQGFMPSFGSDSKMLDGKPMPSNLFWNAVAVNDISAQRDFYQLASKKLIEMLVKEAQSPHLLNRLRILQQNQMSFQLRRSRPAPASTANEDAADARSNAE